MSKTVIHQLQTCKRAWAAVAWATKNDVFNELVRQEAKLQRVVIGTHGSLTDPDCIERLANSNWVSFRSAKGPLFHPKLYLFEHDDRYTVIVGSHNMTRGAFEQNVELSTASELDKGDPTVRMLREFIEGEANGRCITPTMAFISRYRASHRASQRQRRTVDDLYVEEPDRIEEKRRTDAPIHMEWEDWLKKVDEEDEHGRSRRLETLERIQELLRRPGGFLRLPLKDRQRIAGISMERPKDESDVDWNFFGEMTAARRFGHSYARLVEKEEPTEVAAALDLLPDDDAPTRADWQAYWAALLAAAGDMGGISIGGATRLACLKRPDYFVPVTSANLDKLAEQLGVPKKTLNSPEDYWDAVVETILLTPWWNEDRPPDPTDAKTWDARAAMLDAIVYVKPNRAPSRSTQ
ncbi:phospholipase D-like domain-containing protein [Variovorax sp. ZT4R33]|uniref:phospholipase D-like domain-containing protein n=1 Tax=Variovorax sp. ZT4R33 TaxID=3443743 RepID=UPI003F4913AF